MSKTLKELAGVVGEYLNLNIDRERMKAASIEFAQVGVMESKAWERAGSLSAFDSQGYNRHIGAINERRKRAVEEFIGAGGLILDTCLYHSAGDHVDHRPLDARLAKEFGDRVSAESEFDILRIYFNSRDKDKIVSFLKDDLMLEIDEVDDIFDEEDYDIPGLGGWDSSKIFLELEGVEEEAFDCTDINPERTEEEIDAIIEAAANDLRKAGIPIDEMFARLEVKLS